jgi:predicted site-specific integrase-resolvase
VTPGRATDRRYDPASWRVGLVRYARTSTTDGKAELEAQVRDLRAAGAEKALSEQVSRMAKRSALAWLDFLR